MNGICGRNGRKPLWSSGKGLQRERSFKRWTESLFSSSPYWVKQTIVDGRREYSTILLLLCFRLELVTAEWFSTWLMMQEIRGSKARTSRKPPSKGNGKPSPSTATENHLMEIISPLNHHDYFTKQRNKQIFLESLRLLSLIYLSNVVTHAF